jgi:hypothetical protein
MDVARRVPKPFATATSVENKVLFRRVLTIRQRGRKIQEHFFEALDRFRCFTTWRVDRSCCFNSVLGCQALPQVKLAACLGVYLDLRQCTNASSSLGQRPLQASTWEFSCQEERTFFMPGGWRASTSTPRNLSNSAEMTPSLMVNRMLDNTTID